MQSNSSLPILSYTDRLAAQWMDFLLLVGSVLMGWIFISSGWRNLMDIPGFVKTMPRRGPDVLGMSRRRSSSSAASVSCWDLPRAMPRW